MTGRGERRVRLLVEWMCGPAVTVAGLTVALLVARLAGWDLSGWSAWAAIAAIVVVFCGVAAPLVEPLLSRVNARMLAAGGRRRD